MSTLPATLGLTGPNAPSLTPHYLIFHFLFAYVGISSRGWKIYWRLDHNVSPRDDLTKYGPAAVQKGRITQKTLDQMKRVEGAHANSVEHFPLFIGAMIFAHVAGIPTEEINRVGLIYTVVRIAYAAHYILNTSPRWALLRGVFWWTSNIACLRLIWKAGVAINAAKLAGRDGGSWIKPN